MTYEEAVHYIEEAAVYGMQLGLERIQALLKELGNPQKEYKTIHVTGTNGKGSVTAMIASVIENSGISVGRYISPHLESYTERMAVNGSDISEEDFADAMTAVRAKAEKIIADGVEPPTAFELLTAAAFYYFAKKKVEYAVIEVGLGGTLDSTNVITPIVSVITNVTLDHMAQCGETIEEIAACKSGIIKAGVPVVTAAQQNALKVIQKEARAKKAPIYVWGKHFAVSGRHVFDKGQMLNWEFDGKTAMLFTTLRGIHQAVNAGVAAMAITCVMKQEKRLTGDHLREGLARAVWPGRFEVIPGPVPTVLDGAHNPAGIETFNAAYEETFKGKKRIFVYAALTDKDVGSIVGALFTPEDRVFCVPAPTPRSWDPKKLAKTLPCQAEGCGSVAEGLERAYAEAKEGDVVCVVGSLYILGEARRWLRGREKLH